MSIPRQLILAVGILVVGNLSVWVFTQGIEPRPISGAGGPLLVSAIAAFCIAAWGSLLVYLFRRMSRRQLSSGWCPILLVSAFAILFLVLGCFGPWVGV